MDQEPKQQQKRSPLVLILIIIIVLLAAAAVVLAMGKFGGQQELEPAPVSTGEGTPKLGYQEGVMILDEADLQSKTSSTPARGVRVKYQKEAFSTDGETFSCLIANPDDSEYDIYIAIYGDEEFTDELYLSQLIPPGSALTEITVSHKLDKGTHRVYLAYTQVEDDHATLHGQVFVTMDLTVQ